jgi:hypothetical protein
MTTCNIAGLRRMSRTWIPKNSIAMDSGGTKGFKKHQLYPMYTTGPYKIEMKGNRVKVDITVAKKNP